MQLRKTILAQSAAALGVPVLLRRTVPAGEAVADRHGDYVEQCRRGAALLAGAPDTGAETEGAERPVLALNFHDIPAGHRSMVREQLRRLADLGPSFLGEKAPHPGLSILVGFYDGYREAGLFGAEECQRLGIRALFLPIFTSSGPARDGLSDAELADIATVHALGYHTASHRAGAEIDAASVPAEVEEPVRRLSVAAGSPPRVGAYRGGGRFDPGRPADRALRGLGVSWWLSNWSVEDLR